MIIKIQNCSNTSIFVGENRKDAIKVLPSEFFYVSKMGTEYFVDKSEKYRADLHLKIMPEKKSR